MKKEDVSIEDISSKKSGAGKSKMVFIIIAVIVVAGAIAGWKIYGEKGLDLGKLDDSKAGATQSPEASKAEIEQVMAKISKHMVLPAGEIPQMATIANVEEMAKQQVFFVGAQNGDKLLVFIQAKKAVIYSPSKDLVVNVGPVFMDQTAKGGGAPQQAVQSEPQPAPVASPATTGTVTPAKKK